MKSKEENNNEDRTLDEFKWKRIWEYHKEADHLFHQRYNFFLLAESFLILSIVTILVNNDTSDTLKIVKISISLLGILFTFGWWYVNLRIRIRMDYLKDKYLKIIDPVFQEYMNCVKEPSIDTLNIRLHINSQILPIATLIFWWFILLEVILNLNIYYNILFVIIFFILIYLFMPRKNKKNM